MARTAEDILKEAILLETRGKAFYKNVAEKCDSPSAKKIFEMMADEEDLHIKFLSKQFINYTKKHSFLKPDVPKDDPKEERLKLIIELLKANPDVTMEKMSKKLFVTIKTIKRDIEELKSQNKIKRIGGRKSGHWEIPKY